MDRHLVFAHIVLVMMAPPPPSWVFCETQPFTAQRPFYHSYGLLPFHSVNFWCYTRIDHRAEAVRLGCTQ